MLSEAVIYGDSVEWNIESVRKNGVRQAYGQRNGQTVAEKWDSLLDWDLRRQRLLMPISLYFVHAENEVE